MQSDSRLEVIQRPMIMCQDNQIANISIGSSVPIPQATASGQTTGGTLQTTVTYQDVGVILDVEPNINPDGWVYMKVAPEISDVADSSIQIGPGVFAPIFTKRKAETFVAVKDGETVVIGGLITTSDSESESKVPFLGDIPGLGALFRTTTRVKRKTELLIALTPRIVRTVEDGYRLSIEERDKSGIITDEMKSSPFFEKIQLTPESDDQISSIEEIPEGDYAPTTTDGAPAEPTQYKPEPNAPKYGPQVPKYGPMIPSNEEDEDVVARRPLRIKAVSTVGSN
ncbi:MAG: type II and III secretion system protein [Planctomycetes bacterium]|nr:type II and III secretion system protein [Planctomycetota bacterium]